MKKKKNYICKKFSFTNSAENFEKKIPCRKFQFMHLTLPTEHIYKNRAFG